MGSNSIPRWTRIVVVVAVSAGVSSTRLVAEESAQSAVAAASHNVANSEAAQPSVTSADMMGTARSSATAAADDDPFNLERSKDKVRDCFNRQSVRTVEAMVSCSGLLVTPEDLPLCLSESAIDLCLVPEICPDRATGAQAAEVRDPARKCIGRPEPSSTVRYPETPALLVDPHQKVRLPDKEQIGKMKACQTKFAGNLESMRNCFADALLTREERKMLTCVQEAQRDPLTVAKNCLRKHFKTIKFNPGEEPVLRCALGEASVDKAVEKCVDKAKVTPVLKEKIACVVGGPAALDMAGCLLIANKPLPQVAQARCFQDITVGMEDPRYLDAASDCLAKDAKTDPEAVKALSKKALQDAKQCVDDLNAHGVEGLLRCLPEGDREKTIKLLKPELECLNGENENSALNCAGDAVKDVSACLEGPSELADKAVHCLPKAGLKKEDEFLVQCAAGVVHGSKEDVGALLEQCRNRAGPLVTRFDACKTVLDSSDEQSKVEFADCLFKIKNVNPAVACLVKHNVNDMADLIEDCGGTLSKNSIPGLDKAMKIYACYRGNENNPVAAQWCAAAKAISPKQAKLLQCAGKTDDRAKLLCVAGTTLSGGAQKVAEIGTCAVEATGYASGVSCAAKQAFPKVFAEIPPWISAAAECAVTAAGGPAYASCVGTRLLVNEVMECLSGGFFEEGGCLGPNNDVVKVIKRVYESVADRRMGKNNDVRRLGRALDRYGWQPARSLVTSAPKWLPRLATDVLRGGGRVVRCFIKLGHGC